MTRSTRLMVQIDPEKKDNAVCLKCGGLLQLRRR